MRNVTVIIIDAQTNIYMDLQCHVWPLLVSVNGAWSETILKSKTPLETKTNTSCKHISCHRQTQTAGAKILSKAELKTF